MTILGRINYWPCDLCDDDAVTSRSLFHFLRAFAFYVVRQRRLAYRTLDGSGTKNVLIVRDAFCHGHHLDIHGVVERQSGMKESVKFGSRYQNPSKPKKHHIPLTCRILAEQSIRPPWENKVDRDDRRVKVSSLLLLNFEKLSSYGFLHLHFARTLYHGSLWSSCATSGDGLPFPSCRQRGWKGLHFDEEPKNSDSK